MTEFEQAESNLKITYCIQSLRVILECADNVQIIDKVISGCGFLVSEGRKRKCIIQKKIKENNT